MKKNITATVNGITFENLTQEQAFALAQMAFDSTSNLDEIATEKATKERKPRPAKKDNDSCVKWETIAGIPVQTLHRFELNKQLLDAKNVKGMVETCVKNTRNQLAKGEDIPKIIAHGTYYGVKLPVSVPRGKGKMPLTIPRNWYYSAKEHAFMRNFA